MMKKIVRLIATSLVALQCMSASANIGESYGFGSRSAALAGAMVAEAGMQDGFSSFYNPALMPFGAEHWSLSWGVLAMEPKFKPIDQVVVVNRYMGDSVQIGAVDLNYRTTFGNVLGVTWRSETARRISVGLTTFLPLTQVAFIDTGETFAPEYTLERARTQRPQICFSGAALLLPELSIGAGLQIAFSLTAKADVSLQTNLTHPSNMRFTTSLVPKAAPYFGLLFAPRGPQGMTAGLTFRFAASSEAHMDLTSALNVPAAGGLFPFAYTSSSAVYYDPQIIQLGARLPWSAWSAEQRSFLQLEHQSWSRFKSPVLVLTRDPQGAQLSSSQNPYYQFRNILVPRFGHEAILGATRLRAGYSYRPGIMTELPTGAGNMLDPPRDIFQTGLGWEIKHCLGTNAPCELDFHAAYHVLRAQHIDKTAGDETGNASGVKVGSPGYDAGGKIYGGGLSLTVKI